MATPDEMRSPYAGGNQEVAAINVLEGKVRDLEARLSVLERGTAQSLRGINWDALREFDPDNEDWLSNADWNIIDQHIKSPHYEPPKPERKSAFPVAGGTSAFDQAAVQRIIDKQRSR